MAVLNVPASALHLQVSRKWPGRSPEKKGWQRARKKSLFAVCEHCGAELNSHGVGFASKREALRFRGIVDHIVPERAVLTFTKKEPHEPLNLWTLAVPCHGIKTTADKFLCEGNRAAYLATLREHKFPMERVEAALAFYGL